MGNEMLSNKEKAYIIMEKIKFRIFNEKSSAMLSNKEWKAFLDDNYFVGYFVRDDYTRFMFPILSLEFLESIHQMTLDLKLELIAELNCGTGWFSHWLKKYGVPIQKSVDNKSWHNFQEKDYLSLVYQEDSIQFVKRNPGYEMFILSWPYMDSVAFLIWENMRKGQYLFYIGESYGGCTANNAFFEAVEGHEIPDVWRININYLSFYGIYDHITIYQK